MACNIISQEFTTISLAISITVRSEWLYIYMVTELVSHIPPRFANVSNSDSTKDTSFFCRLVAAVRVTQYNVVFPFHYSKS